MNLVPDALYAVGVELLITSQNWQAFGKCLADQQSVERITMMKREVDLKF